MSEILAGCVLPSATRRRETDEVVPLAGGGDSKASWGRPFTLRLSNSLPDPILARDTIAPSRGASDFVVRSSMFDFVHGSLNFAFYSE
jgi:hypothetical protein